MGGYDVKDTAKKKSFDHGSFAGRSGPLYGRRCSLSWSNQRLIDIASGTILTVTLLIPSVKRRLIGELAPAARVS
jgi:hypothetical protein